MIRKIVKRFRFGLRTLLCIPLIVAGVWWWTSWPTRTAQRFVDLLNDGNVEAAQAMLVEPTEKPDANESQIKFDMWRLAAEQPDAFVGSELSPRTFADMIGAAGEFRISQVNVAQKNRYFHFGSYAVVRGRIRPSKADSSDNFVMIYRLQSPVNAKQILERLQTDASPYSAVQIIENADGGLIVRTSREGHDELSTLFKSIDKPREP